jgi:hypothetical protein
VVARPVVAMEGAEKAVSEVIETKPLPARRPDARRPDAAGVFFTALLALWTVLVALQMIDGNLRLWQVFAASAFFEGVNKSLDLYLRRRPDIIGALTPAVAADFLNTSVSLVHSSLISLSGEVCGSSVALFCFLLSCSSRREHTSCIVNFLL